MSSVRSGSGFQLEDKCIETKMASGYGDCETVSVFLVKKNGYAW